MATRTYEPRGGALSLFQDRGPEVCVVGAAGTGKTVAALMKLHLTSLMVPGVQSLVVRQTHASLTASTLVAFEQFVAAPELASGEVVWFGGSGSKPAGYRYPNGSMIMVGGMDNPGKVLSMSLDRILIDEANQVSVAAYETLLTRLRGSAATYKQIVTATNPDHPDHWLKQRADDAGTALRMYTSVHKDNPYLYHRDGRPTAAGVDYAGFLDSLTGVRRLRYRDGIWAAAEGMIYEDWREHVNVIDWFPVPIEWPLFLTVDFGYNDAFVCQWWRTDPDGRLYLTREIHKSHVLVEDHARHIRSIIEENAKTEPAPYAVVCDHQLEDRKTLERHLGMATLPARKAISRGIQLVQARIRKQGDGRPRLLVFRDCVVGRDSGAEARHTPRGWTKELTGYVWQTIRGTDGIPKEVPVDRNNHSLDAGRYAVAHVDWHEEAKAANPAAAGQASPRAGSRWGAPVGR